MDSKPLKKFRISVNSPCVLLFAAICVVVQLINTLTGNAANTLLFSVGRHTLSNPLAYLNCLLHVFGHSGWEHLLGNMMYILLIGPILEEKYGTAKLSIMILITAVITGLITLFFTPGVVLCGASGVAFAMILLCSVTQTEEHTIPLTFIIVALMYLGREIYNGIFVNDSVSQLAHIIGGVVGSGFGFIVGRKRQV